MTPPDSSKKLDCPTIFRKDGQWYMTYIIFDGRGYETWLAESDDLLNWETKGQLMSFSDTTHWDLNQKAGYASLVNYEWGGSYELQQHDGKYWMSYFGGNTRGYEAGVLKLGMAYTEQNPTTAHEWQRLEEPILTPNDENVSWWDNSTMYKSSVIRDRQKLTGHPFVMFYNARGDSLNPDRGAERIGMAVSDDMRNWQRYGEDPVLNHHDGITGDAYIQKIDDLYVMFYFGAFYGGRNDAWNSFAVSYDLKNWTDWTGPNLIEPSEPFDARFAHKSCVVKHDGVVYHFYCAVNKGDDRGIAVATSEDLGSSELTFN
jgi:predicted GH43/DUF377 family glycosyl hydrolase